MFDDVDFVPDSTDVLVHISAESIFILQNQFIQAI